MKAPIDSKVLSAVTGPAILQQPNVPKPLHGIAPRVVYGDGWWNTVRQVAYRSKNFTCHACGVHKQEALWHNWLEAHEVYVHTDPVIKFEGLVALCHSCHNFIHSGRMYALLEKGNMEKGKFEKILLRGFDILKKARLKPWWGTALLWLQYNGISTEDAMYILRAKGVEIPTQTYAWDAWRMDIYGELYSTSFKSENEWRKFYTSTYLE